MAFYSKLSPLTIRAGSVGCLQVDNLQRTIEELHNKGYPHPPRRIKRTAASPHAKIRTATSFVSGNTREPGNARYGSGRPSMDNMTLTDFADLFLPNLFLLQPVYQLLGSRRIPFDPHFLRDLALILSHGMPPAVRGALRPKKDCGTFLRIGSCSLRLRAPRGNPELSP